MRWPTWRRWSRLGRALRWVVGDDVAAAISSGLKPPPYEGTITLIFRDSIMGDPLPGEPVYLRPSPKPQDTDKEDAP